MLRRGVIVGNRPVDNPAPSNFPFSIPPGQNLSQDIGFAPLTAIVNNFSPYWIFVRDGGTYVPPWTTGAIIPLYHAQGAYITWESPFGGQVVGVVSGYQANLIFTNEKLSASGGTPVTPQVAYLQAWTAGVSIIGTDDIALIVPTAGFKAQVKRIDFVQRNTGPTPLWAQVWDDGIGTIGLLGSPGAGYSDHQDFPDSGWVSQAADGSVHVHVTSGVAGSIYELSGIYIEIPA